MSYPQKHCEKRFGFILFIYFKLMKYIITDCLRTDPLRVKT